MSSWTHILGTVEVYVNGNSQYEIEYNLKKILAHLPIVCGSEEDMYVEIIKERGTSVSSNTDEFEQFSNLGDKSTGLFEYQPKYILVLKGDLRDTFITETYRSLVRFLTRLAKRICVDQINIIISDEYGNRKSIQYFIGDYSYWYDAFNYKDTTTLK